jgi:hypothetical protein
MVLVPGVVLAADQLLDFYSHTMCVVPPNDSSFDGLREAGNGTCVVVMAERKGCPHPIIVGPLRQRQMGSFGSIYLINDHLAVITTWLMPEMAITSPLERLTLTDGT